MDNYDDSLEHAYIMFIDANNLYGWGCQQPLPIGGFRRLSKEEIAEFDVLLVSDDSKKGYLIKIYLSYWQADHNCFPLAPEKRSIVDNELSPYVKQAWEEIWVLVKRPK